MCDQCYFLTVGNLETSSIGSFETQMGIVFPRFGFVLLRKTGRRDGYSTVLVNHMTMNRCDCFVVKTLVQPIPIEQENVQSYFVSVVCH